MKVFNQLRYVIFALMLLGCFANFAQNEYGLQILHFSEFIIGLTFIIEGLLLFKGNYMISRTRAIYLISEHFWLGLLFIGYYLTFVGIFAFPRLIILISILFLSIQYLIFGIRKLIKESPKGKLQAVFLFLQSLFSILLITALSWKINHWPGSNKLLEISFYGSLLLGLLILTKRKVFYSGEKITLVNRLTNISGKMSFVLSYFSFWVIFFSMVNFQVIPGFYSLSIPPAVVKLKQENVTSRVDRYWHNDVDFIDHRIAADDE